MAREILTAASIITMDPRLPRAEAVLVNDGRIEAVGSLADCKEAAPDAATTDCGDHILLPGFIDSHSHPFFAGLLTQPPSYWIAPYVGYPTFDDVAALFTKLQQQKSKGQALVFNGLDRLLHGVDELSAEQLDGYFPDRPVAILDNSGHEVYFNSAAMDFLGWSDRTPPPDPTGAHYGRNDDGTSNGRAYETAAVMAVVQFFLDRTVEHPLHSVALWYQLMARNGVTATAELTYQTEMLSTYEALAGRAGCPMRMSLYHMSINPDCGDQLKSDADPAMLVKTGIKLWADGSPWVGTIASSFPYLDNETVRDAGIPLGPGGESMFNYSRLELDAILAKYTPQGWQMAFHVNGDIAVDMVLDAYTKALSDHDLLGTDHGWRVEHCGAARADQIARAADLGVHVSLSPFQFIYWGDLLDGTLFPSEIGAVWQRFADAEEAGGNVSYHNDGFVSPPVPLLNIQAAVTRRTKSTGTLHGPEQAVSLYQALQAQTINGARALRRDDEIGSITVGKRADFVELSTDPFDVDPNTLTDQVQVVRTWLGGAVPDVAGFVDGVAGTPSSEEQKAAVAGPDHKSC